MQGLEISLLVPDLWQQEAVRALQAGKDVVVHAPTGAGKTYIFELLYPSLKGQTVFLCCNGCESQAKKGADKVLAKLAELKKSKDGDSRRK